MRSVVLFFDKAGYKVDSIELAFILSDQNSDSFKLSEIIVGNAFAGYKTVGSNSIWDKIDDESITTSVSGFRRLVLSSNQYLK